MPTRRDANAQHHTSLPDDEDLLAALRSGDEQARLLVRSLLAPDASSDSDDAEVAATDRERAAAARSQVARRLASALLPTDRPAARWLLQAETAALRTAGTGESETLYTLATALARFANSDDALVLWQAHAATAETRSGLDVELLGRLGIDQVRAVLRAQAAGNGTLADDARQALAWLEAGAREGAFDTLADYFTWAEDRFGVRVAGPV